MRKAIAIVSLAFIALHVCGCCGKENAVATAACGRSGSQFICKTCCANHGSHKTTYWSKCSCY